MQDDNKKTVASALEIIEGELELLYIQHDNLNEELGYWTQEDLLRESYKRVREMLHDSEQIKITISALDEEIAELFKVIKEKETIAQALRLVLLGEAS